jgi:hypothetical protein
MRRQLNYLFGSLTIFVVGLSCGEMTAEEKYRKTVKTELAKGTRVDSIFLGLHFGMTSKSFFGHCWELNKQGIIRDGKNNTMVNYRLDSALKYAAEMDFYPDFYEDKIFKMRVEYHYKAWAPWNKMLFADSLLPEVVNLYKKWYPGGNEFISMTDSLRGTIHVKVDGNRRITIGRYNDMLVKADFTDLLVEEKLRKLNTQKSGK